MKSGLQLAWIAVALFGVAIVAWAFWFHRRGGSYLAIPEFAGLVGTYIAIHGVAKAWRLSQ
jgi:hypothetical protein